MISTQPFKDLNGLVIVDVEHDTGETKDQIPDPYDELIERVMERDKGFLDVFSDVGRFTRIYIPGECWPLFGDADYHVTVYRGWPGMRVRLFHRPNTEVPERFDLSTLQGVDSSTLPRDARQRIAAANDDTGRKQKG